ncbi:MAG: HNH endonuclease [Pyrinomonadaceae bacterium]|nr:HNH endonuclease [Pyrinomonadaceae bacterium]
MPKLSKERLLDRFVRAVEIAGWSVGVIGTPSHPFTLYLYREHDAFNVLLYIWNITHGGRHRPHDEYRVQVTGVPSIEQHPEYKTLILGYWEAQDVFAGWDATFHSGPSSFSPSLQIREQYLLAAVNNNFAVCPKDQGELAIAFSPSFLVTYCRNLEGLHGAGTLPQEVNALTRIAEQGTIDEVDLAPLPAPRQRIVRTIEQNYREASFRRRILTAYSQACAMCNMQLKLVDAAHIIPVYDPQSNDETSNGICLCALHHRAMDRVLIAIAPDYRIIINEVEIERLNLEGLGEGTDLFKANLAKIIRTPPEKIQRPNPDYLQIALQVRGWPF